MKRGVMLIVILAVALLSQLAYADVIVFERYETKFELTKDSLKVTKLLRLKNVGSSPIIPGEIHFKVSEEKDGERVALNVANFNVESINRKRLDSRQVQKDTETDLVFTIWDPLLPKFYYDFVMSYEISFDPGGLLFYDVTIPDERTTIPIKKAITEVVLPKNYYVTYAPHAQLEKTDEGRLIRWDTPSDPRFEYSLIPLPKISFPMVNLFWSLVIGLFITIFVIRIILGGRR